MEFFDPTRQKMKDNDISDFTLQLQNLGLQELPLLCHRSVITVVLSPRNLICVLIEYMITTLAQMVARWVSLITPSQANTFTDFIPCCRQRQVPSFCNDFCSFNFSMLKRTHRLCLYYLPDILECFSQRQCELLAAESYILLLLIARQPPKAPSNIQIRKVRHKLLCWRHKDEEEGKIEYSVHVRELPLLSMPSEMG